MAETKNNAERPLSRHVPISEERREIFLSELRRHGILAAAARAASPHSQNRWGCLSSFRAYMRRDPEFKARVQEAVEDATARVEEELHRRSVEGWEEPVYQRGELVGHVTKYSDRLLELRAKGLMPKYIEKRAVEHSGTVDHRAVGGFATITADDLMALDSGQKRALTDVLRAIERHRGGDESDVVDAEFHEVETKELPAPSEEPMETLPENDLMELERING